MVVYNAVLRLNGRCLSISLYKASPVSKALRFGFGYRRSSDPRARVASVVLWVYVLQDAFMPSVQNIRN